MNNQFYRKGFQSGANLSSFVGLVLIWCIFTFTGCGGQTSIISTGQYTDTLYTPEYAKGFQLFNYGDQGSSILVIENPWQEAQGVRYEFFLSRNGESAPAGFEGTVIPVPIQRAVCMASSYVAFLDALDCDTIIKGVSGGGYLYNEKIVRRLASGEVFDVGYDSSINYELLFSLRPDVIFLYGISGESAVSEKLRELKLTTIYIGEYVENSPLGRAEWIVLMGEFTDRREAAERLFDSISRAYNASKQRVKNVEKRPKVMLNAPWRDTWFVPGDRSYIVQLLNDAGGAYASAGVDSDQSRPISIETAFLTASSSDFWFNPGSATTLNDLKIINPNFANIPPVRNRHVYSNNARSTPAGGSDFWESGVVYPHIVLQDMIRILHPELLPDHQLYYFEQLK